MAIQFRGTKGSSLTHDELDQNFREFFYSSSVEGSNLELHKYTSISSSISVPLSNPVGRNGAIQFKLGSAVSGANAQFTGSQNLTFVENKLKVTGSILLDTQNEVGIFEVTGSGIFSGNLVVGGTLTAEEFVTERNTTITIANSGSTIFGDSDDDTHERTGSLNILGAFNLDGSGSVNSLSGSFSGSYQGNVRSTDTIASGSFSGSFEGEGSGVTGIISSSYSVTASYSNTSTSASHAVNADIAPFGGLTGRPTLVSSSIQLGSDISGSVNAATASLLTTASATNNVITFTKGGGATFAVTINTGSDANTTSVVSDTTPQLGGNLDLNTKTISGSGTISMVGNISGQEITGSDALFTNVIATGVTSTTLAATSGITGATLNTTGIISGSIIKSANAISGSSLLIQGTIKATGDVTAFHSSDARLKSNITPIKGALDKIKTIGGYEFDWNDKSEHTGHDVGVIAQEIEFVLPEVVVTRENGYKAVRYEKIVALLIEALKEQQLQIDELKAKL
tara:strand:+ start:15459 stop:16991 length:1533 start_codon:yes stop_codon:yes gene_type:complete